ncbi:Abi family protein, partial [Salmonella enterica]|nr:Abi family protein [Salmonella enterica]
MANQQQNRPLLYQKATQQIPDLIAKLQQRGLVIGDMATATAALTFIGYFRLRGYCLPYY